MDHFELVALNFLVVGVAFVLNFVRGSQQEDNLDLKILELGCGHGLPALSVIKLMEDLIKTQIATLVGIDDCNENKIDKILNLNIIVYMQDFNKQILDFSLIKYSQASFISGKIFSSFAKKYENIILGNFYLISEIVFWL